jgi:hypothetical protein
MATKKTPKKAVKKAVPKTVAESAVPQTVTESAISRVLFRKPSVRFCFEVALIIALLLLCFFQFAPVNRGQNELTTWTKQQSQSIPQQYRSEIKAIFREAYQETASAIRSNEIATTADARLRLSQLIQAKILSLNRLSKNPKELETIIEIMKPISDAIGDRLAGDVEAGKMQDTLNDVQKAFTEIAAGF